MPRHLTPAQRENKRRKNREWYERNRERELGKKRAYSQAHREEKRAYDKIYQEKNRARRNAVAAAYREANREKVRAAVKASYEKFRERYLVGLRRWQAEHKEEHSAKVLIWRKNNPDKVRRASREWARRNRTSQNEKNKIWRAANKHKAKTHKHTRRARIRGCAEHHTAAEWSNLLKAYKNRCVYCGMRGTAKRPLTRDHYVSLSRGGANSIKNIVPACLSCNLKKSTRDPDEFLREELGRFL